MNEKRLKSGVRIAASMIAPLAALAFVIASLQAAPALPQETKQPVEQNFILATAANPLSVTIAGNLQSEMGCSGDWQPECNASKLTYNANGDVWKGAFSISATTPTTYEYKAALDNSWTENYGAHAQPSGDNIPLALTETTTVTFYYDHKSHWVTDNHNDFIAAAAGSFQSELGCSGDWAADCLRSWLQDIDGDGTYSLQATGIPAGTYEFKVTVGESWDENYGQGGAPGGANIPFTIAAADDTLIVEWDSATKVPSVDVRPFWTPPKPVTVTLVGNLQSELGCPGDWQPGCAATNLTEQGNRVWRGVFTIPVTLPITWEYKVALNGTWDESYAGNHRIGGNTSLPMVTTTTVRFYYDHKTHAVLDSIMDKVAVAAGDFQDELGCASHWSPACVNTLLTDVDGDGVYSFQSTDIPAGSYEFKVAMDEGWATSYPTSNVALDVPEADANVIILWDSNTHDVTYTIQSAATLAQPPAQNDVQDQIFYFVMADRFENGDAANDLGGLTGISMTTGFDPVNKGFYHGGDLQGLIDRLDYLQQLGVTAIWMTPMFKNMPVQGTGANASAGYHGYWITDFTQVDPHFGSNISMTKVISEAHNRGIKVFFDIITNHTADVIDYQGGQYTYRNKTDYPYKDASGATFDDRDYINQVFPVLSPTISFPYVPYYRTITDANLRVPTWLNDPIYYHNRGNVSNWDDPEEGTYGDFYGLDDLFTERTEVVTGMIQIYKDWITNFGIDGFRVDTVKHVNIEFWQEFAPEIMAHAAAQGRPDFYIFGEVYSSNKVILSRYTDEGRLPAVLDFSFQSAASSYAAASGNSDALGAFFDSDDYFIDANSNAYILPSFLGNHDMGRWGYFLKQNNAGALDPELVARDELGHGLMYFARGVPVIYYGDEQGFTGDGGDKDARQDMFPSQVTSYNDDDLIGTISTTAGYNFDTSHPLYLAFQNYANLYQNNIALRRGAQIHRYSTGAAGMYAFSRIERSEQVEYIIAFNNAETAQTASFLTYQPAMTFTAIYTSDDASVLASLTSDDQNYVTVTAPALSFVIYKADAALPPSAAAPAIDFTLNSGDEIAGENDRAEISVTLGTQNIFAEVTFAVRVGTEAEYTVIGTDDNPPYRVFYNVGDLPAGTPVSIKAIVNDLNGHYNSAQIETTVGEYAPPTSALEYAIIHYKRPAGDYDGWGLHLWGGAYDPEDIADVTWSNPKMFAGFDDYGAYVALKLQDATQAANYIVHNGDDKDTPNDRSFIPNDIPELWITQGDAANYASRAEAQRYVVVHYHRPASDYSGWGLHLWQGANQFTDWSNPLMPGGYDDYGAVYTISQALYPLLDLSQPISFIMHNGDTKDTPNDRSFDPVQIPVLWLLQDDATSFPHRGGPEDYAVLHYRRPKGDYGDYGSSNYADYWGLHTWGAAADPGWSTPRKPTGQDAYGIYFKVPMTASTASNFGYILHKGNDKDPGSDQNLDVIATGYEIWVGEGLASSTGVQDKYLHPAIPLAKLAQTQVGDLTKAQAYWVAQDTIAWSMADDVSGIYLLRYDANAGLVLDDTGITGGEVITLTIDPAGLPQSVQNKFPHLASLPALKIDAADLALVPTILKGQFAVSAHDSGGALRDATGLQIPGVLDELYTYDGDLGVIYAGAVPSLKLWAPTAQTVTFHLFDDAISTTTSITYPMTYDAGVWSITGDASWTGKYYLYEIDVYAPSTQQIEKNVVTDPYAVSLSMNSKRSQITDLNDPALRPAGWMSYTKPDLAAPEDIAIYELHVRDFSVNDTSVPTNYRGTFKAFTLADSDGMQHLEALADAGLTHLHILPAFDFATVNEDPSQRLDPDPAVLATYPPTSTEQQAIIYAIRDQDSFNWGYDPLHYTVPEGSYSTNPDGTTRIVEFREMVKSLNDTGLRVVMDVVYNHTSANGQAANSVLDKIVPGYYHRLNANGQVETSTCCANTASEHAMMEKLMIDSALVWARQYKVDAFRFDLMGHHMKSNMLKLRAALDALTLANDGVDGSKIYVYGEGWNFGEVQDNARGVNATQFNMAGTGIGTFSDRLRDAVRGGGPFDSGDSLVYNQGYVNGVYYDANPTALAQLTETQRLNELLLSGDQIMLGLAGNLADYSFVGMNGAVITGGQVDYNDSPAGYTADPQEHIVYVSKHDNQTLYDINQYKLPLTATMSERVRAQNVGLSIVSLAQGVPFFHAGSDMLRSKSMDRDSYNSGDWFNRLDFTYQDNNWGVGLPVESVNGTNWYLMEPRLADPDLKPTYTDIMSSVQYMREMLHIRTSSPLFRLHTAQEVQDRLTFHNTGPDQLPGLIVMSLSDEPDSLDPLYNRIVVLFNANDEPQTFTETAWVSVELMLHPVLVNSYDPVVKTAAFDSAAGVFHIPARTTAVFVELEPLSNLHLFKTAEAAGGTGNVPLGGVVTYTLVLSNSGEGIARGVVMSDPLPSGVSFGGGVITGSAILPPPDIIMWGPWDIPAGVQETIRFTVVVTDNVAFYGQVITNIAYFSHAGGDGSGSASFTIQSAPVLTPSLDITKTVAAAHTPVQLGDVVTYTITVANAGEGDAVNVTITDTLPVGLSGADLITSATVLAGRQVEFIVTAVLTTNTGFYGQTINNTAYYSHASGRGSGSASFTIQSAPSGYKVFMPLMYKNG